MATPEIPLGSSAKYRATELLDNDMGLRKCGYVAGGGENNIVALQANVAM